jgi:hypothetical protein
MTDEELHDRPSITPNNELETIIVAHPSVAPERPRYNCQFIRRLARLKECLRHVPLSLATAFSLFRAKIEDQFSLPGIEIDGAPIPSAHDILLFSRGTIRILDKERDLKTCTQLSARKNR